MAAAAGAHAAASGGSGKAAPVDRLRLCPLKRCCWMNHVMYLSACSISSRAEYLASLQPEGEPRQLRFSASQCVRLDASSPSPLPTRTQVPQQLKLGAAVQFTRQRSAHLNSVCTSSTSLRETASRPLVRASTAAGVMS